MTSPLNFKGFHHLTLTVSEIKRARAFYIDLLGFKVVAELSPSRVVIGNDHLFFGLTEPTDPSRRIDHDIFDENRVGLDHLSFTVDSRADLEQAMRYFDEHGVRHAEINDLTPFGISVLMFWDPDNIQLELTAPMQ